MIFRCSQPPHSYASCRFANSCSSGSSDSYIPAIAFGNAQLRITCRICLRVGLTRSGQTLWNETKQRAQPRDERHERGFSRQVLKRARDKSSAGCTHASHQVDDLPLCFALGFDVALRDGEGRVSRERLNVAERASHGADLLRRVRDEGATSRV